MTLVWERLCLSLSWQYSVVSLLHSFPLPCRAQQVRSHIQNLPTISPQADSTVGSLVLYCRLQFLHLLLYTKLAALGRYLEPPILAFSANRTSKPGLANSNGLGLVSAGRFHGLGGVRRK